MTCSSPAMMSVLKQHQNAMKTSLYYRKGCLLPHVVIIPQDTTIPGEAQPFHSGEAILTLNLTSYIQE